jgi:hypothetical protein
MSDEIDRESERLERLHVQKMMRIDELNKTNANIPHKAVNHQGDMGEPKYINPDGTRVFNEGYRYRRG